MYTLYVNTPRVLYRRARGGGVTTKKPPVTRRLFSAIAMILTTGCEATDNEVDDCVGEDRHNNTDDRIEDGIFRRLHGA